MKKSTILALATVLVTGAGAALAQGGPPNSPKAPPTTQPSTAAPPTTTTRAPQDVPTMAGMPAGGMIKTDAEVMARLEAQGYRNIRGLTKGNDGMWHGTASRGAVDVKVMVDARGDIKTQ